MDIIIGRTGYAKYKPLRTSTQQIRAANRLRAPPTAQALL